MNLVVLQGRLTKDPEINDNGKTKVGRYTLAVDRDFKSTQNADFLNCVTFGRLAENTEKYLKKGMLILVTGRIQTGSYTNKDGNKVYTTDIIVATQKFSESKKSFEERQEREAHEKAEPTSGTPQAETPAPEAEPPKPKADDDWMNVPEGYDENDIPFA